MTEKLDTGVVVFLGPSMPIEEARSILDALYLPPARQGDVMSALVNYQPAIIGLVDGEFSQALAVWHKEILFALEQGTRVFGAASMGALRAAETEHFGMMGVGDIFAMYRDGVLRGDDEVALQFAPASDGYRNLSLPLVNIRATLKRALEQKRIGGIECDHAIRLAKSTFFRDRTSTKLRASMLRAGFDPESADRIYEALENRYVDMKRADARKLLMSISKCPAELPVKRDWILSRSEHFKKSLNAERNVRHDGVDVSLGQIARCNALHDPAYNENSFNARNRMLALMLAEVLKVTATNNDIDTEAQRFRRKEGLAEPTEFESWLKRNDMDESSFRSLMEEIAVCRLLHRWVGASDADASTVRALLNELRLRGRYAQAAARAASLSDLADRVHPEAESDSEELPFAELVADHLRRTDWALEGDLQNWADEAGFRNLALLKKELERSRIARLRAERFARKVADQAFWAKLNNVGENADGTENQATAKGSAAERNGNSVVKSKGSQKSD